MIDQPAERWEGYAAETLTRAWGESPVYLYSRVGSTNDVARALGDAGAPDGTVVIAEEQMRGRGRSGRSWLSQPGLGIWTSILLRPTVLPAPGLLPLRVGLALAEVLAPFTGREPPRVKWPNDLLVDGRKVAGVLCEGSWDSGAPRRIVVGIGLNVGHEESDLPPGLRGEATSLRIAAGAAPQRAEVAGAVVRAVRELSREMPEQLTATELARLAVLDALSGKEVEVTAAGTGIRGLASGIAADGALLVRTAAGEIRALRAGSVRRILDGAAGTPLSELSERSSSPDRCRPASTGRNP